jgi:tetratricopeptide (TPR) repeat protein
MEDAMKVVHVHTVVVCASVVVSAACGRSASNPDLIPPACGVVAGADARGDAEVERLQKSFAATRALADAPAAAKDAESARAIERVGYRLIARARVSNDMGDYAIAERAAECMEALQPGDPAVLLLRGHVLHQLHRFHEAETAAVKLVSMRGGVLDYGLLGDVLMEQGRVNEAADAYQKMIDLKPFYQSYTRAAHMRWLKGDLDGAANLMEDAVKSASPRDPESIAWAYTRLGYYELQRGRIGEVERATDAALRHLPNYAAAQLIRGRAVLAAGRATEALDWLRPAAERNPLPEYEWVLLDALRECGLTDEASAVERELTTRGERSDPRTLSVFLATHGLQPEKALALARSEHHERRDVFTLDALAWAQLAAGQGDAAIGTMERALAEGTREARLFLHASVIAAAGGRRAEAARWSREARALRFTLLPSELSVLNNVNGVNKEKSR